VRVQVNARLIMMHQRQLLLVLLRTLDE
jgi:hypothetical protein